MKAKQLFGGILTVLLLSQGTVQAQSSLPPRRPGKVAPKPRVAANAGAGVKDGLSMQKGRVVLTELGISNPLTADKKLLNGTTITPGGLVTGTDGTTTQMMEGDLVSLTGRVTTHKAIMEADSLAKIQLYDAKYPGKRKKAEAERERKAKALAKLEEKKAKEKEKREKEKAKSK